jgi:DegV family protein with EDD domain
VTVAVVTDSAASLPGDVAGNAGVVVVPMWLTLGGESVHDGELSLEEITERVADGFTTSGPTPGEFAQAIERADRGDGVLVLTLSAEMSGTYGAAHLAAGLVEDVDVRVVDTGTAAGAQGLVVLAAAAAAAAGADLDEVEQTAKRASGEVRLVATLPSLEHLARGGRVPGAAAWAGRWLNLHPLFEFRGGHVHPLRPAHGADAAHERVLTAWSRTVTPGATLHVAAMHALDEPEARRLLAEVRAEVEPATAFVGSFSPVMVAHTGPGLVGLAWRWDG